MSYGDSIKRGANSFFLDKAAMTSLADDQAATGHGFLTLVLSGVIQALCILLVGTLFAGAAGAVLGGMSLVLLPIASILGFFIFYSIFHLLAKLFGGQATGTQLFRTVANMLVVMIPISVVSFIPVLGSLISFAAGIYCLVVLVVVMQTVHKLSVGKAIAVVLIPVGILFVILFLLVGAIIMAALSGGMMS